MESVSGRHPRGWFWVGWSHELGPADVRPLRYFGQELVLYRSASGTATLLDGHCPHLGAHLGHGGRVDGDAIVCPFHGWTWGADGRHVAIPYEDRVLHHVGLRAWPVHEAAGLVLAWHDPDGAPPAWDPPVLPEADDPGYHDVGPATARLWPNRRVAPQNPGENVCDPAHLKFVHGAGSVPRVVEAGPDGPLFRSTLEYVFGEGRASTWLTPDGPVTGQLRAELYGVGLSATRYTGIHPTVQVFGVTPIDGDRSDVWSVVLPARGPDDDPAHPTGRAGRIVRHFTEQFDADFPIWENMRPVARPPLARIESGPIRAVRQWFAQFDGLALGPVPVGPDTGAGGDGDGQPVARPAAPGRRP